MGVPHSGDCDDTGIGVALTPAVRARLVALASDVLARMPDPDVPASLRAIARFTPAKRARLGGVALAAALDSDEVFRSAVADIVVASSPDLVCAVREGAPTAASDPVDVAVVAYLVRPTGWAESVVAAAQQWEGENAAADATRQELERLRVEVADLRAQARGEKARTRMAVETAVAESATELTDLRKAVRVRTGETRAAERDAAAARGQSELVRAEAAATVAEIRAETAAELARHRERVAELERAAESTRRGARTARDLDDARLWLLTDTLVQAAAGVRRELALAAPSLRPGDGVVGGSTAAAPRRLDDPASLGRVLALPNVHLIVDGYNVTKTGYGELPLIDQRARLMGALAPLAAQTGAEITIAFDGAARPPAQPVAPRGVRVLFSAEHEIADDLIRRLVAAEPAGRPLVVATSDQQVITDTGRDGAWSVPSSVLLARLG